LVERADEGQAFLEEMSRPGERPAPPRCLDLGHGATLEQDDFCLKRHPALLFGWRMIFSENRCPPRIKSGAGFFGIMRYPNSIRVPNGAPLHSAATAAR